MTALKLPPPVVVHSAAPRCQTRKFASTLVERAPEKPTPLAENERTSQGPGPAQAARPAAASEPVVAPRQVSDSPSVQEPAQAAHRAPTAHAGAATHRADTPLFRHEALRAYKLGARLSTPLSVVPLSTRLVLLTLSAAVLAALAVACFGQVDLTARGRGVIRTSEGVQPLLFEIEGVLRALHVHEGDVVRTGQVLARLDSTRLSATLREADEQLTAIRERIRQDAAAAELRVRLDRTLLERRRRLTHARIASQERSVQALDRDRARYAALADDGLVPDRSMRESEALLHQERRGLLALEDELARIEQQSTELEQTQRAGVTQREHERRDAVSRRDAAASLLRQTELRAARAGRIESLGVGAGDVIAAGRVVARLVPLTTGRRVTAYVPERDRAFVRPGAAVRLELDQLPVGEFGSAAGRVLRVSSEVASQAEMERVLGAAAPEGVHFAIAVEVTEEPTTRALLRRVGSGSLLAVRMPVRRRRIIDLVFDPVRKWLD